MAGFSHTAFDYATQSQLALLGQDTYGTSAIAGTLPVRNMVGSTVTVLSGETAAQAVYLVAGQVITNLTFRCSTASSGLTNWWLNVTNATYVVQASTADQGATQITGGRRTVALTASWTVPSTGIYYFTLTQIGTTPAVLNGTTTAAAPALDAPAVLWSVTGVASIPAVGYTYSGLGSTANTIWMIAT
jgi:hypothetical protein